jgi:hypothetical protein
MQLTLWFLIVSYGIFHTHESGKGVRGMGRMTTGGGQGEDGINRKEGWDKQEGRLM